MNALGRIYLLKIKRYILKSYTLFFVTKKPHAMNQIFTNYVTKQYLNTILIYVMFYFMKNMILTNYTEYIRQKKSCYLSKVRIEYI